MKTVSLQSVLVLLSLTCLGVGCQDAADSPAGSTKISELPPDTLADHDHAHDHPTEGPHHGDLVELGNEEYHAEVVHDDDANGVTIYILDGAATGQVPIDAAELTINLTHDGQPEQFVLKAAPDGDDPEGKSSRLVSDDKELSEDLDAEGVEPKLVVEINGKSYRGTIEHSHDHDHD
ncbi:MAG: hypothetical protein KDA89_20860, partial [Planctomycetaceae bacterium]|nr:hypothetical protein [Planctomycetaceae bacterium]